MGASPRPSGADPEAEQPAKAAGVAAEASKRKRAGEQARAKYMGPPGVQSGLARGAERRLRSGSQGMERASDDRPSASPSYACAAGSLNVDRVLAGAVTCRCRRLERLVFGAHSQSKRVRDVKRPPAPCSILT